MRGKKTSPEQIEEIKALSLVYSSATIAQRTGVSLRTVYELLKRKDSPGIEAKREEKRLEIVDKVWNNKEGELLKLNTKSDLLLDAINDEKITRSRLSELTMGYGILLDKRRLLGDESTQNIAVKSLPQVAIVVQEMLDNERKSKRQEGQATNEG